MFNQYHLNPINDTFSSILNIGIEAQHVKRIFVQGLTVELNIGGETISIEVIGTKVISIELNL